jgi:chromate transporter
VGWLLHKTWGGIVAGALFVLPSALILWVLSYAYVVYGNVPWVAAIFAGLQPAVLAIVAAAVLRIGSKALKNDIMWAIAGAAFVGIYVFAVPFPVIMITAAVIGFIGGKLRRDKFLVIKGHGGSASASVLDDDTAVAEHHAALGRACVQGDCGVRSVVVGAGDRGWRMAWPRACAVQRRRLFQQGGDGDLRRRLSVLPYVSQQAVENYEWLTTPQMMDGLGLAETTPGPLIMVLQFVGFLGGWNQPGHALAASRRDRSARRSRPGRPLCRASSGSFSVRRTSSNCAAMNGFPRRSRPCTAAVVGVILNLAVWFGLHALFPAAGSGELVRNRGEHCRLRRTGPLEVGCDPRGARGRARGLVWHTWIAELVIK